ncbi:hypothetical protein [Flocculibacter collagenilyticus]|uniref:hypothetical protein n=1 Tax=Flocculibacter collagenilyticus TaxID=2744479 RepID=UPI0018F70472|nr:hypothetical protein [Flocculibacter collagenilyticus]
MAFSSELITNVSASDETNNDILQMLGIDHDGEVQYHVYKTQLDDKSVFCCLSGGVIEDNEIVFTPVGLGAFEALTNVNSNNQDYFAEELHVDNGPIKEQVEEILQRVPENAKVCFLGDITGELKEDIGKIFNLALS